MSAPVVSVLMPVYNCGPFVDEAIECILRQTFTDFEFLIVDDASTDDTWERLQKHSDPRIVLSRNAENKGLAQNLNELLAIARGEFIARMDGDDACELDRFQRQYDFLTQHPDHGAVGTASIRTDVNGADQQSYIHPATHEAIRYELLRWRSSVLHGSTMIRTSALKAIGGYRPKMWISEDNDMFLRLGEHSRIANIPRFMYRYRQHPAQSGIRWAEQMPYACLATLLAMEREAHGEDSLRLMTAEDFERLRRQGVIVPKTGTEASRVKLMWQLVRLSNEAFFPQRAFAAARAMVATWPFHPAGYLAVLYLLTSPRTYLRLTKRLKNAVGRTVYRILGAR